MFKLISQDSSRLVSLVAICLILICSRVHGSSSSNGAEVEPLSDPQVSKSVDAITEASASSDNKQPREGRSYSLLGYGRPQQSSMESYAAALAAADSSSNPQEQSTVQANDMSSFASFGEQPSSSSGSQANHRQVNEHSPLSSSYYANFMLPSSNAATYSSQQANSGYYSPSHQYSQYHKSSSASPPIGYPTNSQYDRYPTYYDRSFGASTSPIWASSAFGTGGGLMSSASSALSHWTGGFGLSEIICGLIALSIGAVILGAPFFLIYLALMGNFSGSGTLSLTNPTQGAAAGPTTTVNGRRKRLAVFEDFNNVLDTRTGSVSNSEMLAKRLSPFVDMQQVSETFKRLVGAIEKYSNIRPEHNGKNVDLKLRMK